MQFTEELEQALPADLPNRERLIEKADHHLRLITAANEYMNLTRITDSREAAVKHIYDCVFPWRCFEDARRVLDAGTGAGFPGVPLAVVLPETLFFLSESIQKKARFVDAAVESLELANVHVYGERAEEVATARRPDIITARAVAPLAKILDLFGGALKGGAHLLLYKGPEVEQELSEAAKHQVEAKVVCRYELPHGLGTRTLIRIQSRNGRGVKAGNAASRSLTAPTPR